MIITGEVKVVEFNRKQPLKSFWQSKKHEEKGITHGKEWHRETMAQIEDDFISKGYKVDREPLIRWGRADLGA